MLCFGLFVGFSYCDDSNVIFCYSSLVSSFLLKVCYTLLKTFCFASGVGCKQKNFFFTKDVDLVNVTLVMSLGILDLFSPFFLFNFSTSDGVWFHTILTCVLFQRCLCHTFDIISLKYVTRLFGLS